MGRARGQSPGNFRLLRNSGKKGDPSMPIAEKKKSIAAMSIAVAAIAGYVQGAGVEWPSDFWRQVTNRLEAVASAPVYSENFTVSFH